MRKGKYKIYEEIILCGAIYQILHHLTPDKMSDDFVFTENNLDVVLKNLKRKKPVIHYKNYREHYYAYKIPNFRHIPRSSYYNVRDDLIQKGYLELVFRSHFSKKITVITKKGICYYLTQTKNIRKSSS